MLDQDERESSHNQLISLIMALLALVCDSWVTRMTLTVAVGERVANGTY